MPAYVPITLAAQNHPISGIESTNKFEQEHIRHPLDLGKPILFDCDYEYDKEEDARLTVKWFRNKEPEPFYQWLPELDTRYFADWIRPLVDQKFVSDPHDPLKRYRSILIKRLSMNLTGQYTCLVTSLDSQDQRQAQLILYQPPKAFTFEHRIFPLPAPLIMSTSLINNNNNININQRMSSALQQQTSQSMSSNQQNRVAQPTQFKNLIHNSSSRFSNSLIRPPNNNYNININHSFNNKLDDVDQLQLGNSINNNNKSSESLKIVYTHDGKAKVKQASKTSSNNNNNINNLNRKRRELINNNNFRLPINSYNNNNNINKRGYTIQLHHFLCRAIQLTPQPVMVLTVKRDLDSIAQYLHESSSVNIRPYLVDHYDYFESSSSNSSSSMDQPEITPTSNENQDNKIIPRNDSIGRSTFKVKLYDISVSATIALNVSLPSDWRVGVSSSSSKQIEQDFDQQQQQHSSLLINGINTILQYKPNQRMSFECQLEITGTEFEQRKRINIRAEGKFFSGQISPPSSSYSRNTEIRRIQLNSFACLVLLLVN